MEDGLMQRPQTERDVGKEDLEKKAAKAPVQSEAPAQQVAHEGHEQKSHSARTQEQEQQKVPGKIYIENGRRVAYVSSGAKVIFGSTDEKMIIREFAFYRANPEAFQGRYGHLLNKKENPKVKESLPNTLSQREDELETNEAEALSRRERKKQEKERMDEQINILRKTMDKKLSRDKEKRAASLRKLGEAQDADFGIADKGSFWRISGVKYRKGMHTVDFMKDLLDEGASRNQNGWLGYTLMAQEKGDFHTPDFRLQHSVIAALYKNRGGSNRDEIEALRESLDTLISGEVLGSLTRVRSTLGRAAKTRHKVVHGYGTDSEIEVGVNFPREDLKLKSTKKIKPFSSLLGTKNLGRAREIYMWLTGKETILKRTSEDFFESFLGSPVRLYTSGDDLIISCISELNRVEGQKSLGVRIYDESSVAA